MNSTKTIRKKFTKKRILISLSITFIFVLMTFFIIMPFFMGFIATRSAKSDVGEPPKNALEVRLLTSDNLQLAAWYQEPKNGSVIIVVHGAGNSREDIRNHLSFLTDAGYGILALDTRGHGESDGKTNKLGWSGTKDVRAAIEFLKLKENVEHIGALGLSMGGEILLGAASECPEISAIVSEGATHRSFNEFADLKRSPSFVKYLSPLPMLDVSLQLFSDEKPPKTIWSSLQETINTEFLFIAAGEVQDEIDYNSLFVEAVGRRGQLLTIPDVGHTEGLTKKRALYIETVTHFFEEKLDNDSQISLD